MGLSKLAMCFATSIIIILIWELRRCHQQMDDLISQKSTVATVTSSHRPRTDLKEMVADVRRDEQQMDDLIYQSPTAANVTSSHHQKTVIFYNIYTAPGNSKHTLGIVDEQLSIWRASNVANAILFYMLLGERIEMPCKSHEKCSLLEYKEVGDEGDTLQELHAYCTKNPQDSVIYVHSKGSFHDRPENAPLRQLLTNAVFSDACANMTTDSNSCNVCSARFSPAPHWHTPGNMWIAQCSYIQNLIPPKSFAAHVDDVVERARQRWRWKAPSLPYVGQERFAMEHWVHTHPHVNPCDVVTTRDWAWGYSSIPTSGTFEQARAPRFPRKVYRCIGHGHTQYAGLAYRLFELSVLYNASPTADSWVWDFYPEEDISIYLYQRAIAAAAAASLIFFFLWVKEKYYRNDQILREEVSACYRKGVNQVENCKEVVDAYMFAIDKKSVWDYGPSHLKGKESATTSEKSELK